MTRRMLFVTAAFALAAFAAPPDAKPDFSGEWKLNPAKSDFGPMPPPSEATRTIVHKEPSIKLTTTNKSDMGDSTSELNITTDGKECTGTIKTPQGDIEVKTTATWEGNVLTSKNKMAIGDMEISWDEKWTLSEDGKTMTLDANVSTAQGDFVMKQVYEKAG